MKEFIKKCSAKDGVLWHAITYVILEEISTDLKEVNERNIKRLLKRLDLKYLNNHLSDKSGWHNEPRFCKVAITVVLILSVREQFRIVTKSKPIKQVYNIKIAASFLLVLLLNFTGVSQKDSIDIKPVIGISMRSGILTYYGDLNNRVLPFTTNNKLSYGAGISVKWKYLSGSINYDKIAFGQSLNTRTEHNNFSAKGDMFGLEINFWPVIKKNYGFYIGTGISYINYSISKDSLDKNGVAYHYWSDGSIRNMDENYNNIFVSTKTKRDYTYETSMGSNNGVVFPVRAGIMVRFIKDVQICYNAGFYFTNKSDLDGKANSNKKDYLMYNNVSLIWYFNSYDKVDKGIYKNINYKDLMNGDEDGDGVNDWHDRSFGTPKGVKVDSQGRPLDEDGDGIYDYKDKEKATDKKKLTDNNGIGVEPGTGIPADEAPKKPVASERPGCEDIMTSEEK